MSERQQFDSMKTKGKPKIETSSLVHLMLPFLRFIILIMFS